MDYYKYLYPEFYKKERPVNFSSFLNTLFNQNNVQSPRRGFAKGAYGMIRGNEHFLQAFALCDPCKYRFPIPQEFSIGNI